MGRDAISSRRGMDYSTENYPTASMDPSAMTLMPAQFGVAANATPADTQVRSSPLSDDDLLRLAKIRRNRRLGYMATFEEFDFLLEVIGRLDR
jgi:hypothetical protein